MVTLLITTLILLGISFLGLGVKIFFHHSHKFPETSAGHSPALRKCGITCPHAEEEQNGCTSCQE
ncbi:MAG: hypothetical protein ACTTKZ_06315 [Bacteroides sp.]